MEPVVVLLFIVVELLLEVVPTIVLVVVIDGMVLDVVVVLIEELMVLDILVAIVDVEPRAAELISFDKLVFIIGEVPEPAVTTGEFISALAIVVALPFIELVLPIIAVVSDCA